MNVFDWAGYLSCFSEIMISGCDQELTDLLICSFRDQFLQSCSETSHYDKRVFELEPYLSNVRTTALQIALTRL